jgi:ABC-type antimicrobial peptide transport system permease subunit
MQEPEIGQMTFYVRARGSASSVGASVRAVAQRVDPNMPVFDMKTMNAVVDESLFLERMVAALSVAFGGLATLLAAIGLYGVMSYTVARRTREIGIRMALGADRRRVVSLVLRSAFRRVLIGLVVGVPLAVGAGRLISAQLYGVEFWDPLALAIAAVALGVCAFFAAIIPAGRAAAIQPMTALRSE